MGKIIKFNMEKSNHLFTTMYRKIFTLSVIICSLLLLGCNKYGAEVVEKFVVKGSVIGSGAATNGVKVSFENINDPSLKYVAITNNYGYFEFQDIVGGTYNMDASKDGLKWGWYKDGNYTNQNNMVINISEDKDLVIYLMGSSTSYQFDLDLTDMSGNPIGNSISIPKYTTTVAFRLYNGTTSSHSWSVFPNNCFVSDDIGYNLEYIFNSFSQISGNLKPGDAIVVVGTINQGIFSVFQSSPCYKYSILNFHSDFNSKDVYLDIEF